MYAHTYVYLYFYYVPEYACAYASIYYIHIPPSILYVPLILSFHLKFSLLLILEEVIKEGTMLSKVAQFFHHCSLNIERGRRFSEMRL